MLQAVEALTRTPSCDRVHQRRTSRTSATFALDPFLVEETLDGVIVPGFEGSIRVTLTEVRPAPLVVLLGAAGVYPDGFKVTRAPRTPHLTEAEEVTAHVLIKSKLTDVGLVVPVQPDSMVGNAPTSHAKARSGHEPDNSSYRSHRPRSMRGTALVNMTFAPLNWVVPGFIPPGLTVLAGAPKLGKSWLVLDMAVAVTRGSLSLGTEEECEAGDVLYLALEDNDRRMHQRLRKIAQDSTEGLDRLEVWNIQDDVPSLDQGTLGWIEEWIDAQPNPRLVIVDTLARVRGPAARGQSAYEADYAVIGSLQKLAAEKGIAVIVVTHTRKASATDPFDCVSGTLGISGAADATMVMRKKGEKGPVTLYARGRDIEEFEVALRFDAECCRWSVLREDDHNGPDGHIQRSPERMAVANALLHSTAEAPMSSAEVVTITGMPSQNVRKLLSRMVASGEVVKIGRGKHVLPPQQDQDQDYSDPIDHRSLRSRQHSGSVIGE